ncbi:MAG: lipid A deacylase LpxR family protein [Kordiimonadaceae bacterium]|nr:lipid A deacylase LpxR family protein [Kordiimonadaceae bacterium]MBO6567854.1 lipid A deacylase LpxR family protein [Kordiimonadaceae bacterium]MBO6964416.1 lipid A deacylase LpxR family protein [Kordiimonadaceae bacterium]
MATRTGSKWCRYILVVWLLGSSTPLFAEDDCGLNLVSAQLDQDLFLEPFPGVNEDRDYTMGLFFRFASCRKNASWFSGHEVQHFLMNMLSIGDAQTQYQYSTAFESLTFTPDDLTATNPVFQDKPYSSVLQVTNSLVAYKNEARSATEVSLSLGFLGLPISEWTQTALHQIVRSTTGSEEPFDPKGWNNQISNGGEPTAKLGLTWFYRQDVRANWLDLVYSAGASVGYQTGAHAGVTARFGLLNKQKPVWQTGAVGGYLTRRDAGQEFYGIVSNHVSFVGYNALLQGQFKSNPHELSSSEIERFVLENTIGIGWQKERSDWLFSCTRRSSDFDLAERRAHFFCSVGFTRLL